MKFDVKKLVLIALYTALFVILSIYGTISPAPNMKITIQNLPIYLAGITLGAVPGAVVGFAGMLLNQMITYGFTTTTLFWVLPQTILGAVTGYLFENGIVKMKSNIRFHVTIAFLQILVTILNTIVYAIAGMIEGYYNYILVFGPFIVKLMISVMTGLVFSVVIPIIIKLTKKIH